jgi:hypothetical protein
MFSVLMEAERSEDDEPSLALPVTINPVRTEPAEGYSLITRVLSGLRKSAKPTSCQDYDLLAGAPRVELFLAIIY